MSLQFIIGSSGAGKSYFAYKRIIQESQFQMDIRRLTMIIMVRR